MIKIVKLFVFFFYHMSFFFKLTAEILDEFKIQNSNVFKK